MANLQLDILVIPTYSVLALGVADSSVYPTNPPVVSAPFIEIEFEITNSLDEAKKIILKDKEDIINETQTNTVPRRS